MQMASKDLSAELPPDAIDAPITKHYDIEGVVGEGAYGVVHAARRLADGEAVVVKQIHIDSLSEHDQAAAIQEARMLSQFNHANIIRYHETRYQDGAQSLFNVCTLQRTYTNMVAMYSQLQQPCLQKLLACCAICAMHVCAWLVVRLTNHSEGGCRQPLHCDGVRRQWRP